MAANHSKAGTGLNSSEKAKQSTTTCPIHGLRVSERKVVLGPFSTTLTSCPECEQEEYGKERLRIENQQKAMQEQYQQQIVAGIPPLFRDAKLSDFKNIDPALEWMEQREGFLVVVSPCGRGKSRLACAMTMELRRNAVPCTLVFSSDLFLALRNSFGQRNSSGPSEKELIESLVRGKVLIVDDIGVQKQSEYVIEAWYTIIDTRYRECLPTAFTSNLSLREISLCMSDRVASRLMSGKVMTLGGPDRRSPK